MDISKYGWMRQEGLNEVIDFRKLCHENTIKMFSEKFWNELNGVLNEQFQRDGVLSGEDAFRIFMHKTGL